jgi:hypothetical protein
MFVESSPIGNRSSFINRQRIYRHTCPEQTKKKPMSSKNHLNSASATGIRLTCLLLLISFVFVICTLPISIRLLVADFLPTSKSTKRWQITQLCLTLLMFFNHTVSLYCSLFIE